MLGVFSSRELALLLEADRATKTYWIIRSVAFHTTRSRVLRVTVCSAVRCVATRCAVSDAWRSEKARSLRHAARTPHGRACASAGAVGTSGGALGLISRRANGGRGGHLSSHGHQTGRQGYLQGYLQVGDGLGATRRGKWQLEGVVWCVGGRWVGVEAPARYDNAAFLRCLTTCTIQTKVAHTSITHNSCSPEKSGPDQQFDELGQLRISDKRKAGPAAAPSWPRPKFDLDQVKSTWARCFFAGRRAGPGKIRPASAS